MQTGFKPTQKTVASAMNNISMASLSLAPLISFFKSQSLFVMCIWNKMRQERRRKRVKLMCSHSAYIKKPAWDVDCLKRMLQSNFNLYNYDFTISLFLIECNNKTSTVRKIKPSSSFWFTRKLCLSQRRWRHHPKSQMNSQSVFFCRKWRKSHRFLIF